MARPPNPEPSTRKTIVLTDVLWDRINAARRKAVRRVPSEAEMIRTLLIEALDARDADGGGSGNED